jgi:hypothetical protein
VLLDDGEELDGHAAGLFYAALPLLHRGLAGVAVAGKDGLADANPLDLLRRKEGLNKSSRFPRWLKPRLKQAVCGGTKVPPFQNLYLCRAVCGGETQG